MKLLFCNLAITTISKVEKKIILKVSYNGHLKIKQELRYIQYFNQNTNILYATTE